MNPVFALSSEVSILIPLLVATIAGAVAWFEATRRLSGKIATSEADSLWKESAAIREDYRQRIAQGEERQSHLEERIGKLEERNNSLTAENLELKEANLVLIRRCDTFRDRIDTLESENNTLKLTIRRIAEFD